MKLIVTQYEAIGLPFTIRVEKKQNKWTIATGVEVLNKSGKWVFEPQPSNRTKEFIRETRFDTINEVKKVLGKWGKDWWTQAAESKKYQVLMQYENDPPHVYTLNAANSDEFMQAANEFAAWKMMLVLPDSLTEIKEEKPV